MSRKARLSSEDKKDWTCVRCWTAQKGYCAFKPAANSYLKKAIVILEHESPNHDHPMKNISGIVQELLFSERNKENSENEQIGVEETLVIVVEFTSLLQIRYDEDEDGISNDSVLTDEAAEHQYGKRIEKRVVRFLHRLHLREATIVARGSCCPFAIKLFSPSATRSLSDENVKRLVLLAPHIPPSFINHHLLDTTYTKRLQNVELLCAYTSDREKKKRDAILRHYCPLGTSLTWGKGEINQQHMEVLLPLLLRKKKVDCHERDSSSSSTTTKNNSASTSPVYMFDDERYDDLGRRIFFSELTIVMDPNSKMDVQVSEPITFHSIAPPYENSKKRYNDGEAVNIEDCLKECGALILRGNRIVLCRSLDNPTLMSIPSCELDVCCGEDPLDCALRSIDEKCDIEDPAEQVMALPDLPPMRLFRPNGENKVVDVYIMYAKNAPASNNFCDLGEEPKEDYEDFYDWYSFSHCMKALERNNDQATIRFLKSVAFVLQMASTTNALPNKWGGIFGQEFTNLYQCKVATAQTSEKKEEEKERTEEDEEPIQIIKPLPVTVLSGFLGAGKTTILTHVLQNRLGLKVALIVNDMGAVNIDASLLQQGTQLQKGEEQLVELSNGCICCTLREDLLTEVKRLAERQQFDYLIIESSGISEPLPVAETFTFTDDEGKTLSDVASLDTLVTVVDGSTFVHELQTLESLKQRGWHDDPEDARTVAHLLCDQVEFANVIILNKIDLMTEKDIQQVRSLLKKFNPDALIIESEHGRINPSAILGTKLFTLSKAEEHEEWLQEARIGEHIPETIEYGIHSFTYKSRRPFHPERLHNVLFTSMEKREKPFDTLLRGKGFVWIANHSEFQGIFAFAGGRSSLVAGSLWWASVPKEEWPETLEEAIRPMWSEPHGDRQQEVVLIGQGMDIQAIIKVLDGCVLTDEEYGDGSDTLKWVSLDDPFGDVMGIEGGSHVSHKANMKEC